MMIMSMIITDDFGEGEVKNTHAESDTHTHSTYTTTHTQRARASLICAIVEVTRGRFFQLKINFKINTLLCVYRSIIS